MKLIGAGLSKTGTRSLMLALQKLGMSCIHWDKVRLNRLMDGSDTNPRFDIYDDVDAVLDLPAAWFYREFLDAYPSAKCILTVRDESAWWRSVEAQFNDIYRVTSIGDDPIRWHVRNYVYGSAVATEYLYRKRYREHNAAVIANVPKDRLLVMDITAGEGWEKLCPFLGFAVPSEPFPHENSESQLRTWVAQKNRGR